MDGDPFGSEDSAPVGSSDGFPMPEPPAGMGDPISSDEGYVGGGSDDFMAVNDPAPPASNSNPADDFAAAPPPPPPVATSSPSSSSEPFPAPVSPAKSSSPPLDAMAAWNEEWSTKLAARKDAEDAAKAAAIAQASSDASHFDLARSKAREATSLKNRNEEQVKLEALEADLESVNPWERVVKLVDIQQDKEGPDLSRMRSILIQLKNEPIGA